MDLRIFIKLKYKEKISLLEKTDDRELINFAVNSSIEFLKNAVSKNPNLTEEDLMKLSDDASAIVRVNVFLNPNATDKIVKILSKDEELQVRLTIAINKKTPLWILEEMLKNEKDERLKEIIRKRLR